MAHARRTPDVPALLDALDRHGVRCIVVGSVVALVRGVELTPGDFDVVPATDRENLERLASALREIEAWPPGPFGDWTRREDGRWKWIARPTSDAELAAWRADPGDVSSLDQLFTTRHGDFDVVPRVCGTYEELLPRAERVRAFGTEVLVAHFDDVLSRMEAVEREKDRDRIGPMRAVRDRGREGAEP